MPFYNKFLIILINLVIVPSLFGQVNIEKYNILSNASGLNGNLSFYASARTGNTDIQEFGIDGRVNYKGNSFYSFLIGQGDYGWNKGEEYSNNALIHFRYIKDLDFLVKPEFFTQINYNKSRQLEFRSLIGSGLRISLISDSLNNLTFGSAYMYEFEKLELSNNSFHPDKSYNHRWSNYISYSNSISDYSRLSIIIYVQPRFDKFNDFRTLSENHFSVKLTNKLLLSLVFSLRYDSRPPDNVKDLDTRTKMGISINL